MLQAQTTQNPCPNEGPARGGLFPNSSSRQVHISARNQRKMILAALAGLFASAGSVLASGGMVVSSSSTTLGYNLTTLASATAAYNVGGTVVPAIPFNVLEGSAVVQPNTYIYLPIFYADNSPPADPAFPASIASQSTDAAYIDNLVKTNYNVSSFFVNVDGNYTFLNESYIAGVNTSALPDGGGTEYIVDAAVLTPLSVGTHTIGYGGVIGTNNQSFGSFTVTVPEPTSISVLAFAGTALLRRRRHV